MKRSIEKLRIEYGNTPLNEEDLHIDPCIQFQHWLKEALRASVFEPNGMTLATASPIGSPSSRTVLLKGIENGSFLFYTNYNSRKGEQLASNPCASVTFWWREIYRQVSIEGKVKKLTRKRSKEYFSRRPRGAQIAACASSQSAPLASREELDEAFLRLKRQFQGKPIPCPPSWGGYQLIPDRFEFWQGHAHRLHDRFVYILTENGWLLSRLAP